MKEATLLAWKKSRKLQTAHSDMKEISSYD